MSRVILISVSPGEAWAALCEDDALVELRVARAGRTARAGEIVLGRVVALKPELPAALVDIGEKRPAFLSGEDAAQGLTEGQPVVAQVTKEARADKATTISMRVRLQGALLGLVPGGRVEVTGRGMHVDEKERLMKEVVRLARPGEGFRIGAVAFAAPREDLASDVDALRARWQAIEAARQGARPPARLEPEEPPFLALLAALATPPLNRIVIDDRGALAEARSWLKRHLPDLVPALELHDVAMPLFELEGMASQIETALSPRVALPGGGALTIEAGAVAVTIDVDSGGAPVMATNLAAAKEAARQIRLRNCAGAIVIDFIAMKERAARERVAATLKQAAASDPAAPDLLGWTRLGHFELVRKRRHPALEELLFERTQEGGRVKTALTVALEALRAAAREAKARPARGIALRLAPELASCLAEGEARPARIALEARLGRPISIMSEPGRRRDSFDIGPA
ncbi:MAG TPA: ribonuclease E/G [Stellaceae bacterium]|nr:ribonuclease E/G [Stellaceae bacterium]